MVFLETIISSLVLFKIPLWLFLYAFSVSPGFFLLSLEDFAYPSLTLKKELHQKYLVSIGQNSRLDKDFLQPKCKQESRFTLRVIIPTTLLVEQERVWWLNSRRCRLGVFFFFFFFIFSSKNLVRADKQYFFGGSIPFFSVWSISWKKNYFLYTLRIIRK